MQPPAAWTDQYKYFNFASAVNTNIPFWAAQIKKMWNKRDDSGLLTGITFIYMPSKSFYLWSLMQEQKWCPALLQQAPFSIIFKIGFKSRVLKIRNVKLIRTTCCEKRDQLARAPSKCWWTCCCARAISCSMQWWRMRALKWEHVCTNGRWCQGS